MYLRFLFCRNRNQLDLDIEKRGGESRASHLTHPYKKPREITMIAIELGKTLGCCHILHWRNSAESDRPSGNTNQAGFGFTESDGGGSGGGRQLTGMSRGEENAVTVAGCRSVN